MPNPKLETYKNKATGTVYDYTDAAAQAALAGILDGTDINNFSDVESALATKVDKVTGKGLSTNDYDDTEKAKVATAFPRSEQAVLGAKNLAPINATTVTNKGITLTVDENEIITINGTPTEAVGFEISERGQWLKNGERYKLSGCKGGAADKYKLDIAYTDTGFLAINYDEDEVEFTANNARNYVMRIVVYAGQTMNNVVIKPMVRLATDTDPTFAPHAMTNRRLTNAVQWKESAVSLAEGITANGNKVIRTGNVVEVYLTIPMQDVTSSDKVIGILPFKPANVFAFIDIFDNAKPYEIIGKALLRPSTNELVIPQGMQTTATNIFITGIYICTN